MIETLLLLFVLQGDSTSEWLESCHTDFPDYVEQKYEKNPDVIFCKYVNDLNLSESDIEKLGKEMNWLNYTMQTSHEFVNGWQFFQEHANKETLIIYPSISTRESLPPGMKVTISFNYSENGQEKYFEKPFTVNPLLKNPVCNDDVENYGCIDAKINPNASDEPLQLSTNKITFSGIETNPLFLSIIILGLIMSIVIVLSLIFYRKKRK